MEGMDCTEVDVYIAPCYHKKLSNIWFNMCSIKICRFEQLLLSNLWISIEPPLSNLWVTFNHWVVTSYLLHVYHVRPRVLMVLTLEHYCKYVTYQDILKDREVKNVKYFYSIMYFISLLVFHLFIFKLFPFYIQPT